LVCWENTDRTSFQDNLRNILFQGLHIQIYLFIYFLAGLVDRKELAWDCATGKGQAAVGLSKYFRQLIASDMSEKQIEMQSGKATFVTKFSQLKRLLLKLLAFLMPCTS
jgi:ubiquinone/menaquinone biosynthesis C-methylase UbiE